MSENIIQLEVSSISRVPLQKYEKDFTFFVNGEEFKTTKIISDILSLKISNMHQVDPTFDTVSITTIAKGDFSHILDLINFDKYSIPQNELQFFCEVIEILDIDLFSISLAKDEQITLDNVINFLQTHQNYQKIYSSQIESEIEYVCLHFFELAESHKEEFLKLKPEILNRIIKSPKLLLKSEDQLLHFINHLFNQNRIHSNLYEYVDFLNVTSSAIYEFASIYDINYITNELWKKCVLRMVNQTNIVNIENKQRYKRSQKNFSIQNEFSGIINYLNETYKENIRNKINVVGSTKYQDNATYSPLYVTLFDNDQKFFASCDLEKSFIYFDFLNFRIIPTGYRIKSRSCGHYLKSWKIDVSNDLKNWEQISDETDTDELNGAHVSHTFKIKNPNCNEIRYFKITQTDKNSYGDNYLCIDSIEIFGTLFLEDE